MQLRIHKIVAIGIAWIAAAHVSAIEPLPYDGPQWPTEAGNSAPALEDRFRQFDRALEFLQDQLAVLQRDLDNGAGAGIPVVRRKEPGFRGIYTMQPDGTHVEFLTAAPGMITNADPQFSRDGTMVAFGGMPTIDQVIQC